MGVHLISFKITDSAGKSKSLVFSTPDTATYAECAAFVLQVDSLVDACISGIVSSASVTMSLPIDGALNSTPADDMLVSDGGLLSFDVTGTAYRDSIFIPTVALALMGNDKDIPNTGDMATLITALLSGTNIDLSNKYEQLYASFLSGTRSHRK